jgi:hypothetical protein
MRIELVIDELVLHGFDPCHRHAIGDAVQAELTRVLAGRALGGESHQPMVLDELDAGVMAVAPGRSAGDLGRHIARAIAGVMPRPEVRGGGSFVRGGGSLDPPTTVGSDQPPPSGHQRRGDA